MISASLDRPAEVPSPTQTLNVITFKVPTAPRAAPGTMAIPANSAIMQSRKHDVTACLPF
jgi:hypothetical protein